MNVSRGTYKTKCGYEVTVARIVSREHRFFAEGAVLHPSNGTLCLHAWTIEGTSLDQGSNGDLDLVEPNIFCLTGDIE